MISAWWQNMWIASDAVSWCPVSSRSPHHAFHHPAATVLLSEPLHEASWLLVEANLLWRYVFLLLLFSSSSFFTLSSSFSFSASSSSSSSPYFSPSPFSSSSTSLSSSSSEECGVGKGTVSVNRLEGCHSFGASYVFTHRVHTYHGNLRNE